METGVRAGGWGRPGPQSRGYRAGGWSGLPLLQGPGDAHSACRACGQHWSLPGLQDPGVVPPVSLGRQVLGEGACPHNGGRVTCPAAPSPLHPTGPGTPQCSCPRCGRSLTCRCQTGQSRSPPSSLGGGGLSDLGPGRLPLLLMGWVPSAGGSQGHPSSVWVLT